MRTMVDVRVILSALWGSLMLVFLLGDVLRIFAGDYTAGELAGVPASQSMWVGIAALMLTPILMMVLSLVVPYPAIRWVCIVAAGLWIVLNLMGLPYPGAYDNFLIGVSVVVCGAIIWYGLDVVGCHVAVSRSSAADAGRMRPTGEPSGRRELEYVRSGAGSARLPR